MPLELGAALGQKAGEGRRGPPSWGLRPRLYYTAPAGLSEQTLRADWASDPGGGRVGRAGGLGESDGDRHDRLGGGRGGGGVLCGLAMVVCLGRGRQRA